MIKVLVTGAAGFIGSNLCEHLIESNYTVVGVDNLSTGKASNVPSGMQFYHGDIEDVDFLDKVFKSEKPDVICHLASNASIIQSSQDMVKNVKTSLIGTINVLNKSIEYGAKQFLFASSMTVYGNLQEHKPDFSLFDKCEPISPYGIFKYAAERVVAIHSKKIPVTIFRIFNCYGKHQSLDNPYQGCLSIFIGKKLRNEKITIYGNGLKTRDFVYVGDVCEAWARAIKDKRYGIYNIGTGIETTINQLISMLGISNVEYLEERQGEQERSRADINFSSYVLGWKPKILLEDGIKKTLEWAQNEKI